VEFSEMIARSEKAFFIELSARDTAVAFYLKLGYSTQGPSYLEKNIPHIKMTKQLAVSS